ncbi:MAG: sigma 54-interacting transcriptional regulator [Oscillospiraceae bacterium]|nr:sigma 54-interacting transcriptional regulator [Oscillospiraceae bacterium]
MDNTEKLNRILGKVFDYFGFTVITDESGYILKIDDNYAAFLGVDADDAVGKYVTDVIPGSAVPYVLKTKKSDIGSIFILKDGHPIVTSRVPIFDDGKLIGAMSTTIFDSIDQTKKLNRQIQDMARESREYKEKYLALRNANNALSKIVGDSPAINKVKKTIASIAASDLVVLITGETGVGKELFANAVHELSGRCEKDFIKINCAAIPSELLESELFGYEEGAFSGARRGGKKGKFELANGGTILLDEIGDMPLMLQSKLLRVLQEQEIEPVGGLRPKKINVRLLCSTNCDLEKLIQQDKFRSDLYYRINTVELKVPPLRERREDIPVLCRSFIEDADLSYGIEITGVEPKAMELLCNYAWPGNVREFKHCLERACVEKSSGTLGCEDFAFKTALFSGNTLELHIPSIEDKKRDTERRAMIEALKICGGNRTRAAEIIKMSRAVFFRRMKEYGLS